MGAITAHENGVRMHMYDIAVVNSRQSEEKIHTSPFSFYAARPTYMYQSRVGETHKHFIAVIKFNKNYLPNLISVIQFGSASNVFSSKRYLRK